MFSTSENENFNYSFETEEFITDNEGNLLVGKEKINLQSVSDYTDIKLNDISQRLIGNFTNQSLTQYFQFMVMPEHTDNRFGFKITFYLNEIEEVDIYDILYENFVISLALENVPTDQSSYLNFLNCETSIVYFNIERNSDEISLVFELRYLKQGMNYLSLSMIPLKPLVEDLNYKFGIFRTMIGKNLCHSEIYYSFNEIVYTCFCMRNTAGPYCGKLAFSETIYESGLSFLIISNLAMIPALIVGSLYLYYGEVAVYLTNMLASMIYHTCD